MSILFEPMKIGEIEVENRFVRSATCENMAKENGEVTDDIVKTISTLAKGEIGLIIPGYLYIHPLGKAFKYQTGIHSDDMILGLKRVVEVVHQEKGKIAFQIAHAGPQTYKDLIGTTPIGPSRRVMNPATMLKPKEMNEDEINESIQAFVDASRRVVETGADAIQFHAAHGYLISQFLSPFFNHRKDEWGSSDENRFRYLKEIILETKKVVPKDTPILLKINAHDYTEKKGITVPLAAKYSEWLKNLGVDCLEISCGTGHYSTFAQCRGNVPVKELVQSFPPAMQPIAKNVLKEMVGKYDLEEGYNLEAAKIIKPVLGDVPLMLVGGLRSLDFMEEIVKKGHVDFVSMSRPLIREPFLVKNFKEGGQNMASCISCNRCLAALPNNFPTRCYAKKFPEKK